MARSMSPFGVNTNDRDRSWLRSRRRIDLMTLSLNATKHHLPAVIVGCIVGVLLFLFLCFCCCIRRRETARLQRLTSKRSTVTKPSVSDASVRSGDFNVSTRSEILLMPEGTSTPKVTVSRVQPESISSGSAGSDNVLLSKEQEDEPGSLYLSELGRLRTAVWYDKNSGILTVTVISADNVPVRDLSGYSYSTVVICLTPFDEQSDDEKRTHEVRSSRYMRFGETFTFVLKQGEIDKQVLSFYLYESNHWSAKEGVAQTSMKLAHMNLSNGQEHILTKSLAPYDPHVSQSTHRGSLYIEIDYEEKDNRGKMELSVYLGGVHIDSKQPYGANDKYFAIVAIYDTKSLLLQKKTTEMVLLAANPDLDVCVQFTLEDGLGNVSGIIIKLKEVKKMRRNRLVGGVSVKKGSQQWSELLDLGSTRGWFPMYKKK